MEENRVKEKVEHKQGKPWSIKGKFKTYEEAKEFAENLQSQENFLSQIKVKFSRSLSLFVVKAREIKKD